MRRQFGTAQHPSTARVTALASCLVAAEGGEKETLALARQALAQNQRDGWFHQVHALAFCRAGQLEPAILALNDSNTPSPGWKFRALNWLTLALTYQRYGNPEEARRHLKQAEIWFQNEAGGEPHRLLRLDLDLGLEFLVLLNEARRTIPAGK